MEFLLLQNKEFMANKIPNSLLSQFSKRVQIRLIHLFDKNA